MVKTLVAIKFHIMHVANCNKVATNVHFFVKIVYKQANAIDILDQPSFVIEKYVNDNYKIYLCHKLFKQCTTILSSKSLTKIK